MVTRLLLESLISTQFSVAASSFSKNIEFTEKYRDFPREFPKDSLPVDAEVCEMDGSENDVHKIEYESDI